MFCVLLGLNLPLCVKLYLLVTVFGWQGFTWEWILGLICGGAPIYLLDVGKRCTAAICIPPRGHGFVLGIPGRNRYHFPSKFRDLPLPPKSSFPRFPFPFPLGRSPFAALIKPFARNSIAFSLRQFRLMCPFLPQIQHSRMSWPLPPHSCPSSPH